MKTSQLRNLKETIWGVQSGQKITQINENTQNNVISEEVSDYITSIITETESRIGIKLTEEEIKQCAMFIFEQIGNSAIIEAVQNHVGFQLNEDEISYVLNTLNEQV